MSKDKVIASISVILPITVDIDGCTVSILEVHKYTTIDKRQRYIVSCRARCGDKTSNTFFIDVESNSELLWKLRIELSKFRLLNILTI